MAILSFLVSLAGATMLLLFAVRMVRTGIERSFGASFKRILTQNQNQLSAGLAGVSLAVVLQSSAAVALLTSGFMASGLLGFPAGLAIVLGGDLGSALIIQILSFRLDWLVPLLLAVGGWLFVKSERKKWRQVGRILLGVAFILISLRFLREAMDPIRDSAFLPAIAEYLARDFVTAFIVGAALAFVMHSSVAAILMCVTLVQIDAIPLQAGISLILGANLGSAFIPIWLSRGIAPGARSVLFANLALRGTWAVVVLVAVNQFGLWYMPTGVGPGQALIFAHIGFNLSLLCAIPFGRALERPFAALMSHAGADPDAEAEKLASPVSALDGAEFDTPQQAVSNLKRELLRMIEMVERMFQPSLDLYETEDKPMAASIRKLDKEVNQLLEQIRQYVARFPGDKLDKSTAKTIRGLMDFAIRLELAGDVVCKDLSRLAEKKHRKGTQFSKEGWKELQKMHEAIAENLRLSCNVLISEDIESARLLMTEKTELKRAERDSRKRHYRRLQDGHLTSLETSDIHIETLRALRDFNSHISAIAYPTLHREGQLLETRLILDTNNVMAD